MFKRKQLDAIVCMIRSNEWDVIESYTRYGPIVTWQRLQNEYLPSVFMDQFHAYWTGLEHLHSKGYRKILSIYPTSKGLNTEVRIRAHSEFIIKHKLRTYPFLISKIKLLLEMVRK